MRMRKEIDECERIGTGMTDTQKIRYFFDENKLKRGTITGSYHDNELHLLKYENPSKAYDYDYAGSKEYEYSKFCDKDYIKSDEKYGCLGVFMSGSGYRISILAPVFEWSSSRYAYRFHSYKTKTNDSITYEEFIKLIEESNYEIDLTEHDEKLKKEIERVEEKENIYYAIRADKNKLEFGYEDNYTNSYFSISIKKEPGNWLNKHRNRIELNIGGYEIEIPCMLNEFEELYSKELLKNEVESAIKNKITVIENGYLFNNKNYEELDDLYGAITEEKANENTTTTK